MKIHHPEPVIVDELVVNWHVLEACNYHCRYCYAHWEKPAKNEIWRTERWPTLLEALWRFFAPDNSDNPLRQSMRWKEVRLSLAGGEPTLLGRRLTEIAQKAHDLGFNVSLISNGSRLKLRDLERLAPVLSVLGLSVDAIDPAANAEIGRIQNDLTLSVDDIALIVATARRLNPDITIKLNTVVNAANVDLHFHALIECIRPERWKLMRMLPITTHDLSVSGEEFQAFLSRHASFAPWISAEGNDSMRQSYIMVDPLGRFFQNMPGSSQYLYSDNILAAGPTAAFRQIPFSPAKFASRYEFQRQD